MLLKKTATSSLKDFPTQNGGTMMSKTNNKDLHVAYMDKKSDMRLFALNKVRL